MPRRSDLPRKGVLEEGELEPAEPVLDVSPPRVAWLKRNNVTDLSIGSVSGALAGLTEAENFAGSAAASPSAVAEGVSTCGVAFAGCALSTGVSIEGKAELGAALSIRAIADSSSISSYRLENEIVTSILKQ